MSARFGKIVAGFAAGFLGSVTTIVAVNEVGGDRENGEPAEVVLGQVDFDGYCERESASAVLVTQDAFGWRCIEVSNGIFVTRDVDPTLICAWQYDDEARAVLMQANDPQGWRCFGPREA